MTKPTPAEAIKSCPFCGNLPKVYRTDKADEFVECRTAGCILRANAQWTRDWQSRPASSPPSPALTVSEEMVERALTVYYGSPDWMTWKNANTTDQLYSQRVRMRSALTIALTHKGPK